MNAALGELARLSEDVDGAWITGTRTSPTLDTYRVIIRKPLPLVVGVDQTHALGVIVRLPNPSSQGNWVVGVWGCRAQSTYATASLSPSIVHGARWGCRRAADSRLAGRSRTANEDRRSHVCGDGRGRRDTQRSSASSVSPLGDTWDRPADFGEGGLTQPGQSIASTTRSSTTCTRGRGRIPTATASVIFADRAATGSSRVAGRERAVANPIFPSPNRDWGTMSRTIWMCIPTSARSVISTSLSQNRGGGHCRHSRCRAEPHE